MANDLKLCWHPDFGAVLCIEGDSEQDIADLIKNCPFIEDSTRVLYGNGRMTHVWFRKKRKCFVFFRKLLRRWLR